jgi:hypothetical protein
LLAAAPASADGWRKHHKRHHKHAKHHWKHDHRHHHGGHGRYYAPRVVVNHVHGYPVRHYGHGPAYYCGPCSHYFDSYDHLSHHVHDHHHVAAIHLPAVIFQASIGGGVGWVFDH